MAVAFRAATSGTYNATSGTATIPATTVADDLLVLYNIRSANDTAPVTPSGWTVQVAPVVASSLTLSVYTRIAQAGDAGSNVTIQWAATGRVVWGIAAYSGVDTTTPLDVTPAVESFLTTSASTSHTTPTLAAATAGSYAVDLVVTKTATIETSITPPAGVTEDHQYLTSSTSSPHFAIGHEDAAVAVGADGGGNTWTTVQSSQYIVATLMLRASAPAAQSRTAGFSLSLAGSATVAGGASARSAPFTLALSAAAVRASSSTAVPAHSWAGGVSASGFVVTSKLTGATSVRLAVSTSSAMTSPTFVGAQLPDGSGRVRHVVTGLNPQVRYYFRLADTPAGGTETLVGPVGTIKTTQTAGTPITGTRKVLIGACIRTNSTTTTALTNAMGWAPDWGHFNGDFFYSGSTSTAVATQAAQWDNALANVANLQAFVASGCAAYYNTSDHEAGPDNGDSNNAYTAANISAYKQLVPYRALLDTAGTTTARDQQWDDGRVSFYMLDCRTTDRSPGANTDNSSKTMLGAAQKARLLDWLANHPSPFKVIISDPQWMGPTSAAAAKPDAWWSYDTERQEIIAAIGAQDAHVELWHGDSHLIGYATPAKNTWGGFPVLCAAGYDQDGGGQQTSTFSSFWNNASADVTIYGRVTFTDDGTTITRVFSGWDATGNVERLTDTVIVDTSPARTAPFTLALGATAARVERERATAAFALSLSAAASSSGSGGTSTRTAPFALTLGSAAASVEREPTTAPFSLGLSATADANAAGGVASRTAPFTLTLVPTATAQGAGGAVVRTAPFALNLGATAARVEREVTRALFSLTVTPAASATGSGGVASATAPFALQLVATAHAVNPSQARDITLTGRLQPRPWKGALL